MTEEDEAFNDIERQAKQRKESVRAAINKEKTMNNPPAFPSGNDVTLGDWRSHGHSGMTLRDYFAARALQGYISAKAWHPDFVYSADFNFDAGKRAADAVAVSAYKWADAMLKAREA